MLRRSGALCYCDFMLSSVGREQTQSSATLGLDSVPVFSCVARVTRTCDQPVTDKRLADA